MWFNPAILLINCGVLLLWELIPLNIGEKIRQIRKTNELNQIEFASRIKISQGTLSDIERGVCLPSSETLIALKENFKCDLNWLLVNERQKITEQVVLTTDELMIIKMYRDLSLRDQQELIEIMKIKNRN
jgi:Predicted transcriptional regulator